MDDDCGGEEYDDDDDDDDGNGMEAVHLLLVEPKGCFILATTRMKKKKQTKTIHY